MQSIDWKTVATFSWLQEAQLLKMRLEAAGFEAHIPGEHVAQLNPLVTMMQVPVQVRASELERAREFLDISVPEDSEAVPQAEVCPACGSKNLIRKSAHARNWVVALVGLLFGAPMRAKQRTVCGDCKTVL
jgi:hypothetical protein